MSGEQQKSPLEVIATIAQVLSIVITAGIAIVSFNHTRDKDAEARRLEAQRPFLALRQTLYADALKQAGILSTPEVHSKDELASARKRFRELYVSELSMVESHDVEKQMIALAGAVDPELTQFTESQTATYKLAHALRDGFIADWGVRD